MDVVSQLQSHPLFRTFTPEALAEVDGDPLGQYPCHKGGRHVGRVQAIGAAGRASQRQFRGAGDAADQPDNQDACPYGKEG